MKRKWLLALVLVIVSLCLTLGMTACGKVEFKVNFVVEGEVYATVDTNGNEVIKMPTNPTKEGYTFDGWFWDNNEWEKPFTANSLLDAPLSSDMSVYAKFVSNEVPPSQQDIIDALKKMPNVVAVAAATEYNDPNGQLNKDGGYIADIFFSIDVIYQNAIPGTTLVEKGTDAGGSIEVYLTAKDAERRNTYLSSFDGGILSSGSHKVIGTCVVRTADSLTASLQNILESNIEKILTGSSEALVSMDTYLIEVAKQVAEEEKLSEYETATKLIELGYPLEKAEQIAKNCGVNWNNIAKGLAEGYADYYAMVSPLMIAELLADHEFSADSVSYAIQNANIDWEFYATRHAEEFVAITESQHEYLTPNAVLVYLCWEKGYIYDWDEYVFDKSEYCEIALENLDVNWNQKALEYIDYIEADGPLAQKSAYISELTGMDFTQEQAEYAVANCDINWNSRALSCVKHFVEDLCTTPPNHSACISKLKEWGFSDSEANYAVNNYTGIIYPDKLDYVISLDPNSGTVSKTTIDVEYGKTFSLPTPAREGYEFSGWYKGSTKIENGIWYTAENISVKAEWTPIRYNITYVLDGGTNGSGNPSSYTTGSSITLKVPSKTGYTFLGWKVNGSTTAVYEAAIYSTDTGAKTFTATWTPNKYTIYYNADGGNVSVSSEDVYYDAWVTLKTPTRDGYTFMGWKEEDRSYSNGYWKTTRSVFLKATWELNAYSITYENMQNGTSSNPISYTVNDEIVLKAPTRTGYTFKGWTYSGQTTPVMSVTIPKNSTGNKTYTVNWEANTYTVTYNANGGTCEKVTETVTYGQYFKPVAATRTGYNFNNWHYDTGKGYHEEYCNDYYNIAGDVTLEAWWNAKTFTITYNPNGGSISSTTQSVSYDSNYTLRTPTRTGYTFKGWKNGTSDFTSGKWNLTAGVTLVAQWEANTYTVTYDANGGEVSKTSDSIKFDSSLTLPTPTRVGYTFAGWYNNGTRYYSGSWTTAKSLTLTAKWTAKTNTPYVVNHYQQNIYDDGYTLVATDNKTGTSDASVTPARNSYTGFTAPSAQTVTISPDGTRVVNYYYTRNSYTITFVTNGGETLSKITQKYQSTLNVPDATRQGYTFGGWYTNVALTSSYTKPTTMPSSSKTIYAYWVEENKPGDFTYSGTSSITVSAYKGSSATMWIPAYIGGKPVATIAESAFASNTTITIATIPNTVTSIGKAAFKGCSTLTTLSIPFVGNSESATESYKQVLGYIFGYTTSSSYSSIPDNKTSVYSYTTQAVYDNVLYKYYVPTSLVSVSITKQTAIPTNAFRNCDLIKSISIPVGTTAIGSSCFYNCTALERAYISSSMQQISDYAFYGCSSITEFYVDGDLSELKAIGKYAFAECSNVRTYFGSDDNSLAIPSNVETIGSYAFQNNKQISQIIVPNSVASIGVSAFKGCSNLTNISLPFVGQSEEETESYKQVFGYIFGYTTSTSYSTIPDWTSSAYTTVAQAVYENVLYKYYVPTTLVRVSITKQTAIPANAFRNCDLIQTIDIPTNTESIGTYAFYNCTKVAAYNGDDAGVSILPETLVNISANAFTNNVSLTKVLLSSNVQSIGSYAFSGCTALTEVKTAKDITTLTSIGSYAFRGCTALAYYFNGNLGELNIPTNTDSIGSYAFQNNKQISKIVVSNTVTSIGSFAFNGCSALTDIALPFVGNSENATESYKQVLGYIFGWDTGSGYSSVGNTYLTSIYSFTAQAVYENVLYRYYIPKSLVNVTVTRQTAIPANAFRNCDLIETINIPTSIVSIGAYAFSYCKSVVAYNGNESGISVLPETLVSIPERAFENNAALMQIKLPSKLQTIGTYAFSGCSSLVAVKTDKAMTTLTDIGGYAFSGCSSVAYYFNGNEGELNIPVNTKTIGAYAFQNNVLVEKLVVADTVETIGAGAFKGCAIITDVTLPFVGNSETATESYKQVFGYIFGWDTSSGYSSVGSTYLTSIYSYTAQAVYDNVLYKYYVPKTLVNVTITKQVAIPANAFRNCNLIESVDLPANISSFGDYAFNYCSALENLNVPTNATIGTNVFDNSGLLNKTGLVYIGTILYKYNGTMPSGYTLNVKAGTTAIQANAFSGCSGLAKVIFPNSLISIGQNAFKNCSSLTEVEIPSSVTSIGSGAFSGCSKLTTISVPFIGTSADSTATFSTIFGTIPTTLTNVIITEDVSVGANAFKNCTKLQSIVFEGNVNAIGANAFNGCSALATLTLPNTITSIGDYAFSGCTKLSVVDMSQMRSLAAIGSYAFQNCSSITTISVPESVTTIGDYTFSGCTKLTTAKLSSKTTDIGTYAFNGCTALTTLTLNSDVLENIGAYAFQNCSALTTIYIPASVETIGEYAFNGCTALTINCEATSLPADWDYNWNPSNCKVNWGK